MFTTTHIISNPAGGYSLVGRVPLTPRTVRFLRPTDKGYRAAIMGQRWVKRDGRTYGWSGRNFPTKEAAERALRHASR